MIDLREERAGDAGIIREIHHAAFGGPVEGRIVDLARRAGQVLWSIIAELDGMPVGHILVTPMTLDPHTPLRCIAIGPIGVLPKFQGDGIGSALMQEIIARAREDNYDAILLLGNPRYYHRFGFETASVGNEYGADEAFMALQLMPGCLDRLGKSVVAKYIPAFMEAENEST